MRSDWQNAAVSGDVPTLAKLLADGTDIDCCDRYGQTALMLASLRGRGDAVRSLLKWNAALDVTAKFSLSALMLAIINRHTAVARLLLEAGADTSIKGTGAPGFAGKTAYDLAFESQQFELAELIQRRRHK